MGFLKAAALGAFFACPVLPQQRASQTECLEALPSSGCQLRWEFQISEGNSKAGTNAGAATPNLLAVLDYQWRAPQVPAGGKLQTLAGCFTAHLIFKTGYTQSMVATRILPAQTASGAPTVAPLPQPAFESGAASTFGWTMGRNGQGGVFAEFGFGARASFDDLISANQAVQNQGSASLSGLYEATAHFNISSWNHNQPAGASGAYSNVSNLLAIEAGYQDNSGLAQLIPASPQINTRVRFVGRMLLSPELPNSSHTKLTLGMEFSGGINGGEKIVQIFAGTNLNPAKIFSAQ